MLVVLRCERVAAGALASPGRTSAVGLSRTLARTLTHTQPPGLREPPLVLRLESADGAVAYVLWNGRIVESRDTTEAVYIAGAVAENFGLLPPQTRTHAHTHAHADTGPTAARTSASDPTCRVSVLTHASCARPAARVTCVACSAADWALASVYADILQGRTLEQVAVVWVGARLTMWVTPTTHLRLRVQSVSGGGADEGVWVLRESSEIVVGPPVVGAGAGAEIAKVTAASSPGGMASTAAADTHDSGAGGADGRESTAGVQRCLPTPRVPTPRIVRCLLYQSHDCSGLIAECHSHTLQMLRSIVTMPIESTLGPPFICYLAARISQLSKSDAAGAESDRQAVFCVRKNDALPRLTIRVSCELFLLVLSSLLSTAQSGDASPPPHRMFVDVYEAHVRPVAAAADIPLGVRPIIMLADTCGTCANAPLGVARKCAARILHALRSEPSACIHPGSVWPMQPFEACDRGCTCAGALIVMPKRLREHATLAFIPKYGWSSLCEEPSSFIASPSLAPWQLAAHPALGILRGKRGVPSQDERLHQWLTFFAYGAHQELSPAAPHNPVEAALCALGELQTVAERLCTFASSLIMAQWNAVADASTAPGTHILVTGPEGSGKTSAFGVLRQQLSAGGVTAWGPGLHVEQVECRTLVGQLSKSVDTHLEDAWHRCCDRAPAVLLLDDVDALLAGADADTAAPQAAASAAQTKAFVRWFDRVFGRRLPAGVPASSAAAMASAAMATSHVAVVPPVVVIASAASLGNLPRQFIQRWFPVPVAMPKWSVQEKRHAMSATFSYAKTDIVGETEKQSILDVWTLASSEIISDDDVRAFSLQTCALLAHRAAHLTDLGHGAELDSGSLRFKLAALVDEIVAETRSGVSPVKERWESLQDVGGMFEAKADLKSSLFLRVKHRGLLLSSPIRLPRGFLLFGPPGCGKTLLARAAATHCGLRVVSVKGPQVLNKYIGSSEQAIRDLFLQAAASAPCMLLFDELESIAPRRGAGHGGTGVTDRLVNQLLTFLDGVEMPADDVFVVATTSRPDMIDPALLRPGRFDKHVFCGLPTAAERADIAERLAERFRVHASVVETARVVAACEACDGFTGADLLGLFQAAAGIFGREQTSGHVHEGTDVLQLRHLTAALADIRPSLASHDRHFFLHVCAAFMDSRHTAAVGSLNGSELRFLAHADAGRTRPSGFAPAGTHQLNHGHERDAEHTNVGIRSALA